MIGCSSPVPGQTGVADRERDQTRAMVGGVEALPFGLLICAVTSLVMLNAWAVLDARLAADAAAAAAARSFVEADDPATAAARATLSGTEAFSTHGWERGRVALVDGSLQRCVQVTMRATVSVPALVLPFVGGIGPSPVTVSTDHTEVVDPYRAGLQGAGCG